MGRFKDSFYHGKRLSFAGELCTVRYVGPLEDTQGQWLGVEWDNVHRGKHNGRHRGKSVFKCLSQSTTAASFIRPTREADRPRILIEALHSKYRPAVHESTSSDRHGTLIEISGKMVEEIGFEKIMKEQAALENLRIAVLDRLCISGLVDSVGSSDAVLHAQTELKRLCPNVVELDVGWNLLETWHGLVDLVAALPQLRVLRASALRLREVPTDPLDSQSMYSFPFLHELVLDECLLTPEQLCVLLSTFQDHFPALRRLSLSSNHLTELPVSNPQHAINLSSVTTLLLENNAIDSLTVLNRIYEYFPNLETLSLLGNKIKQLGSADQYPPSTGHLALRSLDLSHNQVADFAFIDGLPRMLPELSALRLSGNPVYTVAEDRRHAPDTSFYLTLARIPSLKSLNYTTITPRDREEGEIYYLSVAEKTTRPLLDETLEHERLLATVETCRRNYPRYDELCTKYDRDSLFSKYLSTDAPKSQTKEDEKAYPVGSLGARIIHATFHMRLPSAGTEQTTLTRRIPRSIEVYRIKGLVSHHFGLPPLQFKLIYESPEFDPVKEVIGDRDDWERWGDWDVDDAVDAALRGEEEMLESGQHDVNTSNKDGILFKEGRRWKRREIELLDGWREWGFWLEDGVMEATVRVEPFDAPDHWR